MDREAAAALELSRRRAKQASGAIRKATRLLAQMDDGFEHFGSTEVRGPEDIERAAQLIAYALEECGAIDVVLLIGTDHKHHGPQQGAKEEHHAKDGRAVQR